MSSLRNVAFILVLALIVVACTPAPVAPAADQPAETMAEAPAESPGPDCGRVPRRRLRRGRCLTGDLPRPRRHAGPGFQCKVCGGTNLGVGL